MKKIYTKRELMGRFGRIKAGLNYINSVQNYTETASKYHQGRISYKEYDDKCTLIHSDIREALRYI